MRPFRLRNKLTGFWYKGLGSDLDIIWTSSEVEATIFPKDKREFWENDPEIEIVDLAEDEIMAAMGAPRLPGF